MSQLVMEPVVTADEYIRRDNANDYRLELINNRIIPMAGSSEAHVEIVGRLYALLFNRLYARGCKVYTNDMRVQADQWSSYTYPDVAVACGRRRFRPDAHPDTLINPTLLFEVLSPTTEALDRGEKYEMYLQIPSLQGYFMVAQDEPRIECVQRDGSSWIESEHTGMDDSLVINAPACQLPMRDIYLHLRMDA